MAEIALSIRTSAELSAFQKLDAAEQQAVLQAMRLQKEISQAEAAAKAWGNATVQANEKAARSALQADAAQKRVNDNFSRRMGLRHGSDLVLTQQTRQMARQMLDQGGADGDYGHGVMQFYRERTANRDAKAAVLKQRRDAERRSREDRQRAEREANEHDRWQRESAPGLFGNTVIDMARAGGRGGDVADRARRYTARRIRASSELNGKVDEAEFDRMVDQNTKRLSDRLAKASKRMADGMRKHFDGPGGGNDIFAHTHNHLGYGSLGRGGVPTSPGARRRELAPRREGRIGRAAGVAGGVGVGVGAALIGLATGWSDRKTELGNELVELEQELAPIYAVGNNASRRVAIRGDVFSKSIGNAVSRGVVAEAMGRLQAIAADLPKQAQQAIMDQTMGAASLGVQDLSGFALGLNSLQRNFAPTSTDPRRTVQLANKYVGAADRGGLDPDTFAPYLSPVASAAKTSGYSEDDAFALMEITSKAALRDETLSTGVRNIPLKMIDASRLGKLNRTGNMLSDLEQVRRMTAEEQVDIFGLENIGAGRFVLDNLEGLRAAREASAGTTGDRSSIELKRAQMLSDPVAMPARLIGSAQQVSANAAAVTASDPNRSSVFIRKAMIDAGVNMELADAPEVVRNSQKYLGDLASGMVKNADRYERTGVLHTIQALDKEKKTTEAASLRLRYGKLFGLKTVAGDYTGETEAQAYEKLVSEIKLPELDESVFLKLGGTHQGNFKGRAAREMYVNSVTGPGKGRLQAEFDWQMATDPAFRDEHTIKPMEAPMRSQTFAMNERLASGVVSRQQILGGVDQVAQDGHKLLSELGDRERALGTGNGIDAAADRKMREEAESAVLDWEDKAYSGDLEYYDTARRSMERQARGRGPGAVQAKARLRLMDDVYGDVSKDGNVTAAESPLLREAADGRDRRTAVVDPMMTQLQSMVTTFSTAVTTLAAAAGVPGGKQAATVLPAKAPPAVPPTRNTRGMPIIN